MRCLFVCCFCALHLVTAEEGRKPENVTCVVDQEEWKAAGRKVMIVCRYRSQTLPRVQWSDEHHQPCPEDRLRPENEFCSRLQLQPTTRHPRNVTFIVSNSYGQVVKTLPLHLAGQHLSGECTSASDCVTPNAICIQNICSCPNANPVHNRESCLPAAKFGQHCEIHEQCEYADNRTTCGPWGKCICISGYAKDRDRCIFVPEQEVYVVVGIGLGLVFVVSAVLGIYFYRKRKDQDANNLSHNAFFQEEEEVGPEIKKL